MERRPNVRHIEDHALAIGQVIRAERLRRDLSQDAVADLCGVPKARTSRYENGHIEPTVGTLVALAGALNTTASSILNLAGL